MEQNIAKELVKRKIIKEETELNEETKPNQKKELSLRNKSS